MPLTMQPVVSKMISHIGYDPETQVLAVTFRGKGETYHYPDVSEETHQAFAGAKSKGQHFLANIRGKMDGVKQEPKPADRA